jgi:hypothetical protein
VSLADWYAVCDVLIPFNRVIDKAAVFIASSGEKTAELRHESAHLIPAIISCATSCVALTQQDSPLVEEKANVGGRAAAGVVI